MDPLTRAERDFSSLADRLRNFGASVETEFDSFFPDGTREHLKQLYADGDVDKARRLIRGKLAQRVRSQVAQHRRKAEELKREVEAQNEALETWKAEENADSFEDFVLGRNVTITRRLFGETKAALVREADVISRPTLVKIENGEGARLSVVEALAGALDVPTEALLLESRKIATLYSTVRPLDDPQELLRAAVDRPNDAATYTRHRATGGRLDPETLRVIGDVLESVDEAYDNPAARAGAAVGWAWGLPPDQGTGIEDRVARDLAAGVLGGWWLHELSNS